MATQANLDYVQKMFVAYLGRAASASAQEYYADLLDANEANGKAVLFDDLYNGAEAKALYAGMTNDQIITQIFQNCFNRDPAFAGLTYYYDAIGAGTFNILEAAAVIANDANAADSAILVAKQTAADKITTEIGSDADALANYTGNASEARESLNKVTDTASAAAYDATAELAAISGGNQIGTTFTLTTLQDIPAMTADNDTVNGAQTTYTGTDIIADNTATDADVLNVTATADITATPTVSGIETVNFNLDSFTSAGGNAAHFEVAADNVAAGGAINVNVTKSGSSISTAVVTGLVTGSNVTFGSAIATAATVTGADNAALTATSSALAIEANSGGTLTAATLTGTGAATTTTTMTTDSDAAATLTTTASDMTVAAATAKTVVINSAKDVDANTTDLSAATSVNITAGDEVDVGLDAAAAVTVSAGGALLTSQIDDAAGNTLKTVNVSGNGTAHTFDIADSEGVTAVNISGSQDVSVTTSAANVGALTNDQITVTDSSTGTSTMILTASGDVDTSTIGTDVIKISGDNTGTLEVASGQTLTVTVDQTGMNIDGSDAGAASNTATLILNDGNTAANAAVDTGGLVLTDLSAVTIDVSQDSNVLGAVQTDSEITGITGSADNTSVTINAGTTGVTLAGTVNLSGATGGGMLVINSDGAVALGTTTFDVASLSHTGSGAVTGTMTATEVNSVTTGSGIDNLTFDGLGVNLTVNTGGGNDNVTIGANTTAAKTTTIDMGDGSTDTLTVDGNRDLGNGTAFTLTNAERISFTNGTTAVTVESSLLDGKSYLLSHATAGDTLVVTVEMATATNSVDLSNIVVDGLTLTAADSFTVNGSAKTSALTLKGANTMANTLTGGTKGDAITGGDAADTLSGGAGADAIIGGGGDDTITGGDGGDTLTGGLGNNTYVYTGADADTGETITFNTTTGATETIKATGDVDLSAINAGAVLTGMDAVTIDNGANGATATFAGAQVTGLTVAVTGVNLGAAEILVANGTGQDDTISLAGFTATDATLQLDGNGGDDTLTGSTAAATTINGGSGADTITGGDVVDTLNGGDGADTITGGKGADVITGGDGIDSIVLTEAVAAADDVILTNDEASNQSVVTGFGTGDQVIFDESAFATINFAATGAVGDLAAGDYNEAAAAAITLTDDKVNVVNDAAGFADYDTMHAAAVAGGAGDAGEGFVVFYNSATSKTEVYFDADLSNNAGEVLIAQLDITGANLAATLSEANFGVV